MKVKLRRSIGVTADIAVKALTEHYEQHGSIKPRVLVDESSEPDAPLHPAFEWRDPVAADQFRLIQARNIVRAVHIVSDEGEDRGCAFAHVAVSVEAADEEGENDGGGYHPVAVVAQRVDMFELALAGLTRKLHEAQRAVEDLCRQAESGPDPDRARQLVLAREQIAGAVTTLEQAAE